MKTTTTTIERLQQHASEKVSPGMPASFTTACGPGDGIWQGDLGLEIVASVPNNYALVKKPRSADKQLVPGNTQGSRHCLDALVGVKLYRPKGWGGESVRGPCFVTTKERKVLHPTHGAVTIPAGLIVLCRYQREWDKEQELARRAQD